MRGIDPYDLVFDLLLEEGPAMYQLLWTSNSFSQADLQLCLEQNECAVISDTLALAPYGPLEKKVGSLSGYGWTPEFLNKYVNEKNIISIEEGIRRMTSLPAQRLGVKDRGILKENMKADIVVFDTSSIRSLGLYFQVIGVCLPFLVRQLLLDFCFRPYMSVLMARHLRVVGSMRASYGLRR